MNLKDACWLRYVNGGCALWRHAFEACDAVERCLRMDGAADTWTSDSDIVRGL